MKRKPTKQSKSATGRRRSAVKSRGGMKMGARATSRSSVNASAGRASAKTGTRPKKSGSSSRGALSARSNSRVNSRAGAKGSGKTPVNARAGRAISKAVDTLKSAVTSLRGRAALKSTSETPAKRGARAARTAEVKQPLGTSRPVNAATKPSVGSLPTSDVQHASPDERMAPHSDRPYTGADAFKPEAKGAETLMSAPPRKPIRQSRNQVGLRHH